MYLAQYMHYYDGPMTNGGYGMHDSWLGAIIPLLVFVVFIGLAVYVVRALTSHHTGVTGTRDPIDIARERYAKGEITKEELADIKKELR